MRLKIRLSLLFLVCLSANFGMMINLAPLAQAQRFIPRGTGTPGRTQGGGTRGNFCEEGSSPLIPIVSPEKVGLTTQPYPSFTWYLPATEPTIVEFVLQEGDRNLYATSFQVTGEAKLVTLELPQNSNLPPLKIGTTYTWKFILHCQKTAAVGNFAVTQGRIERVTLSQQLSQKLKHTSLPERAKTFAQEGIWYDATSSWLEARRQTDNPELMQGWQELIRSVPWGLNAKHLDQVIKAPISTPPLSIKSYQSQRASVPSSYSRYS